MFKFYVLVAEKNKKNTFIKMSKNNANKYV